MSAAQRRAGRKRRQPRADELSPLGGRAQPLAPLALESRERILDVGAGTGELTAVLREESSGEVIALDADVDLVRSVSGPRVAGDALRLPFADGSFDLVVCQALLVNLPDPVAAIEEFARVSRDCVAVVEPDNSAVTIDSTVDHESRLARRARSLYLDGVETDVTLGPARKEFEAAGLDDISVRRYDHVRRIESPYTEQELEDARRKVTGAGLDADRSTILTGETTPDEFDRLRDDWQAMGREVVSQMQDGSYEHRETVPFFVTVGHV
jgi:SAM-dependent methyltransferase